MIRRVGHRNDIGPDPQEHQREVLSREHETSRMEGKGEEEVQHLRLLLVR